MISTARHPGKAKQGVTQHPRPSTGEMAKFRLAPFGTVFSALKAMLDEFGGSNVDAVAELLDTAGRFLYRLPETHVRMANMADVRSAFQSAVSPAARGRGDLRRCVFEICHHQGFARTAYA